MLIKKLLEHEMQYLFKSLQGLQIQLHAAKEIVFLAALHAEIYMENWACWYSQTRIYRTRKKNGH